MAGHGAKKDFWNIDRLLHFTIDAMIDFYEQKYPQSNPGQVVRSLVFFADADEQKDPINLQSTTWQQVKERILTAVQAYVRGLAS